MPVRLLHVWIASLAVAISSNLPARGDDPDVKALIELLRDKDESIRLKAAKDLGRLKAKAKDAIPALTAAVRDPDEDVRSVAKRALEAVKAAVEDADDKNEKLEVLVKHLRARDMDLKVMAIEELAELGPAAKEAGAALVEFGMLDATAKIRDAASAALEKIDPDVHKEVVKLLENENQQKTDEAIAALKAMGNAAKAGTPAMHVYFAKVSSNIREAEYAFSVLQVILTVAPEDAKAKALVLGAVGSKDIAIQQAVFVGTFREDAIKLMNTLKFDNKQKYTALTTGLDNTFFDRALIIKALGQLGPDAKAALPRLMKLKVDPDVNVRQAATTAIDAIKQ